MERTWIYCSIFSELTNWGLIMKEGIKPILVKLSITDSFKIRFDFSNGPNIQFALLTNQKECARIAKIVDLHFKLFFSSSKLFEKPSILPVDSIFIPFPQNSVHYGLYAFNPVDEDNDNNLRYLLSEIILLSSTDNLDDTSILTLGLYLHLSIIKVYNQLPNDRFETSHARFVEFYQINQKDIGQIADFVEANGGILIKIFQDVFVNDFEENNNLFWLTRWQAYLKIKMAKVQAKSDGYYHIIAATTINEFLGFDTEAVQLLNLLIHESISLEQGFSC